MPTIRPQVVATPLDGSGLRVIKWVGIAAGDTIVAAICAGYPDKTVQFLGTFGGSMGLEGSIDPDGGVYATLNDPQGNALSAITAAKIENVLEHCYLIRPTVGSGVSSVDVWLLLSNVKG